MEVSRIGFGETLEHVQMLIINLVTFNETHALVDGEDSVPD